MGREIANIKLYFDWDDTIIKKTKFPLKFNGSTEDNDLKVWIEQIDRLEKRFAGQIRFEKYILTSRTRIDEPFLKALQLLNFKPIDKKTGKTVEDKTKNVNIAIHYPEFSRKIIFKKFSEIKESFPYFVWDSTKDKLRYYADNIHFVEFFLSPEREEFIKGIAKIIQVKQNLDLHTKEKLFEVIFSNLEKSHIVTYSPEGKVISKSALEKESFIPPVHVTPLKPKAYIMNDHYENSKGYSETLASILIDDQPSVHSSHLSLFKDLFILGCEKFKECEYNSPQMLSEIGTIFVRLTETVASIYKSYTIYQSNLWTLSPYFKATADLKMGPKVDSGIEFSYDNYLGFYELFEAELREDRYQSLAENSRMKNCYLEISFFLSNYSYFFKKFDKEKLPKESLLDLIPLLKLIQNQNLVVSSDFNRLDPFQQINIEINHFLEAKKCEPTDFQRLIENISINLKYRSKFYSAKCILFVATIFKLHQIIDTKPLPGFKIAVEGVMEILNNAFRPTTSKSLQLAGSKSMRMNF